MKKIDKFPIFLLTIVIVALLGNVLTLGSLGTSIPFHKMLILFVSNTAVFFFTGLWGATVTVRWIRKDEARKRADLLLAFRSLANGIPREYDDLHTKNLIESAQRAIKDAEEVEG